MILGIIPFLVRGCGFSSCRRAASDSLRSDIQERERLPRRFGESCYGDAHGARTAGMARSLNVDVTGTRGGSGSRSSDCHRLFPHCRLWVLAPCGAVVGSMWQLPARYLLPFPTGAERDAGAEGTHGFAYGDPCGCQPYGRAGRFLNSFPVPPGRAHRGVAPHACFP